MLKVVGDEAVEDRVHGRSLLDGSPASARAGCSRRHLETEVAAYLEAHRDERDVARSYGKRCTSSRSAAGSTRAGTSRTGSRRSGRSTRADARPDYLAGRHAGVSEPLRRRARQNVIFELGFSVGRLGREHVCALYEDGVELPSDIHGVEYTALDTAGAWRGKVARELYEAGLRFDPLKVID